MPTQIRTLNELKAACKDGPVEISIQLNGGAVSSKQIQHFPDGFEVDDDEDYVWGGETMRIEWEVFHNISDSREGFCNDAELLAKTLIGDAIAKGALYSYGSS